MMHRGPLSVIVLAIALLTGAMTSPALASADAAARASRQTTASTDVFARQAMVDRYCVRCHNERLRTAGLVLENVDVEHPSARTEVWEKVIQKLRTGAMPPLGSPAPDPPARAALIGWLEGALDRAAAARPHAARTTIHRLNRAEYANVIRDLLAIEFEAASLLPADNSAHGFDNVADVLTTSGGLIERYLSVAQRISRQALGDTAVEPDVDTYFASPVGRQEQRQSEDLPFGTRGGVVVRRFFPLDGEYAVKTVLERTADLEVPIGITRKQDIEVRVDGALVKRFTYGGISVDLPRLGGEVRERADDSLTTFDARIPMKAGTHVVGVTFVQETLEAQDLAPTFPTSSVSYLDVDQPLARVERVEIAGPFGATGAMESPARRRIFICRPTRVEDELPCATRIVSRLARQAYRRPVTKIDIAPLMRFYQEGRRNQSFDAGIQGALEGILVSPHFIFRVEQDPAGAKPATVYRVSDIELASRLSFFLWSSIPDEELLTIAASGRLHDATVLSQQVRRMLASPKASALVSNFAGQWLMLRNLAQHAPDTKEYPDFDDDLRAAFQRETELFLESQLREDRSIMDLLRADYTFLNEGLAKHYGVPNIYGSHFRRVRLTDTARPGLLGHASILTVTSYPNRTSPVERGKWILENVLGAPPPPPPANVPPLQESAEVKFTSMRERMEQHRRNPACAVCHAQMDPLGFALENFDGVGLWRGADGRGQLIDASGTLPDGTKFNGAAGLRDALLTRSDEFVSTVTTKLLTYAVGRGIEAHDMPAVRKIVRHASANGYRWSAVLAGIAESAPFRMRRTR